MLRQPGLQRGALWGVSAPTRSRTRLRFSIHASPRPQEIMACAPCAVRGASSERPRCATAPRAGAQLDQLRAEFEEAGQRRLARKHKRPRSSPALACGACRCRTLFQHRSGPQAVRPSTFERVLQRRRPCSCRSSVEFYRTATGAVVKRRGSRAGVKRQVAVFRRPPWAPFIDLTPRDAEARCAPPEAVQLRRATYADCADTCQIPCQERPCR